MKFLLVAFICQAMMASGGRIQEKRMEDSNASSLERSFVGDVFKSLFDSVVGYFVLVETGKLFIEGKFKEMENEEIEDRSEDLRILGMQNRNQKNQSLRIGVVNNLESV